MVVKIAVAPVRDQECTRSRIILEIVLLCSEEAAALAVVSAVIVVQVTSWQTVRKSIERILGVIIGVSLAVLVAHLLGLNFWTITLIIFFAQVIGLSCRTVVSILPDSH